MKKIVIVGLLLLLTGLVRGQAPDNETLDALASNPMLERNPIDLVGRFQGIETDNLTIESRPAYQVGDQETFTIAGSEDSELRAVTMTLMGATDDVYMWVEEGLDYDPDTMQRLADDISAHAIPTMRQRFGVEDDVDNDPHIYSLNVITAGPGIAGVFNDGDRYPSEIIPSSNEINSLIMVVDPRWEDYYLSVFAHEFQHLVQAAQDDSEDTWIVEGIAELGSLLAFPEYFSTGFQESYIASSTGNQLNDWPYQGDTTPYYGGASLFLSYITQQYGEDWTLFMAQEPADGVLGIEKALEAAGVSVSFDDIFADFVITNFVNDASVGEGQFTYTLMDVSATAPATQTFNSYPLTLAGQPVNQYGTQYYRLESATDQTLTINFTGQETAYLLPTQPHSGQYYRWSQWGNQANSHLTGRFDLSDQTSATLKFWTWYEIEEFWDYGYMSISTDDGKTWTVLTHPEMTSENPYDRAFTTGFTGESGSGQSQPYPYLGVLLPTDTTPDGAMRIDSVEEGGPSEKAGLQAGDIITAINGLPINLNNFESVILRFRPNQAVTITVQRDAETLELPLTFAAHPERTRPPQAEWVSYGVDLTPYVGGEVLIRFDYVTDQAASLSGWLLDDITIPEIGFSDDFESLNPVWESAGWVQINNLLPQHYIVQVIEKDANGEQTVRRLLMPQDAAVSGSWTVEVGPNREAVLVVSGAAQVTRQPASFNLEITGQ